jgi:hypothetical protein
MNTPHTKLKLHLERHAYKRGRFAGDAPADKSRRYKTQVRVTRRGDDMCVRMYNTDIIRVAPDNTVTLNMNGWHTSTTVANTNDALSEFIGWGGVGKLKFKGLSQLAIRANGKTYLYYDGMEFSPDGKLLSEARPFQRKITDRDDTAEFRKDIEDSGFKAVFPVLFAAAEPMRGWITRELKPIVTSEWRANVWPDVAAHFKVFHDDHKSAYRAIVQQCTRDMTLIEASDVTVM